MSCQPVFEPDEDYDRTYASDGVSRYGIYLAQYMARFIEDHQPTADAGRFAAAAWQIAQPPIMSPGYVRAHGRVQATAVRWDEDQRQAVCVELAVASAPETASLTYPWRGWNRDEAGCWREPDDYTHANVLIVLRIAVPLAGIPLPTPCYERGRPDTKTAKQAVRAICATVNAATRSVVASDALARSPR